MENEVHDSYLFYESLCIFIYIYPLLFRTEQRITKHGSHGGYSNLSLFMSLLMATAQ